ncbi:DUF285 domain-containing protein [Candidatus Saccharibacteria bacterium]|nr:DUF285 domain-containing protein [Candidatus Saccharibacteria bacterium]
MKQAFYGAKNIKSNATDQPNLSNVTDVSLMFRGASAFEGDLSQWDVSNVTDMSYTFGNARVFNSDISQWDVSHVTNMSSMFTGSETVFNGDISQWDVSNVTNMSYMFAGPTSFNGDISQWDVSHVTNMQGMFYYNNIFNGDISQWDVSHVTNMADMFGNAASFDRSLADWNIGSVQYIRNMLSRAGLSVGNYDATLTGWASQTVVPGLELGAANLEYCSSQTARQKLIDESQWTITGDRSCHDTLPQKQVHGVEFLTDEDNKVLKVMGIGLVGVNNGEYVEAFSRSLVSLNGSPLKFCAFGGMTAAQMTANYGNLYPSIGNNVTDDAPCYVLTKNGVAIDITLTQALVRLSSGFDTTAQGTVSVNGSPVYTFNQQTTPGVDEPTAIVENKPLTGVPVIPKRPHFSGTAEPGATVIVTVHSDPISCAALADSNGNWSCQLPSDLESGQHTVNIHIVLPGGGTQDLGPYIVTVNSDGASAPMTNTTPLAPNTGLARTMQALATQSQGLLLLAVLLVALCVGGMVVRRRFTHRHNTATRR